MTRQIPKVGDVIKFGNGMVGKVTAILGRHHYADVEAVVNKHRVYGTIDDLEVINALERIVTALETDSDR